MITVVDEAGPAKPRSANVDTAAAARARCLFTSLSLPTRVPTGGARRSAPSPRGRVEELQWFIQQEACRLRAVAWSCGNRLDSKGFFGRRSSGSGFVQPQGKPLSFIGELLFAPGACCASADPVPPATPRGRANGSEFELTSNPMARSAACFEMDRRRGRRSRPRRHPRRVRPRRSRSEPRERRRGRPDRQRSGPSGRISGSRTSLGVPPPL